METPSVLLQGYAKTIRQSIGPIGLAITMIALLAVVVLYGAAFTLVGRLSPLLFTIPQVSLALLCIWALPDTENPPERFVAFSLIGMAVITVAWPNYVAIALPALPWITFQRIFIVLLAGSYLFSLATSSKFRQKSLDIRVTNTVVFWCMLAFIALQFLSIGVSKVPLTSLQRVFNYQLVWTIPFFSAAVIFRKDKLADLFLNLLWAVGIFACLIGLWENKVQHVLWAYDLPSFLRIQDPAVLRVLTGNIRTAVGLYRVESTFSSPLSLSEYLALCLPILLVRFEHSKSILERSLAIFSVPLFLWTIHLTDAHLGNSACAVVVGLYTIYWAASRWRWVKNSVIGPAFVMAAPLGGVTILAASFVVPKIRNLVWGDGSHAASTAARVAQYSLGLPKILSNPFGYGAGQGADVLNYSENGGMITIDAYYLSIALEYGVVGFLIFYGMFLYAIKDALWFAFEKPSDAETPNLKIVGFALIAFVVIKSVFSEQDNHSIVFTLLGLACAAHQRVRDRPLSQSLYAVA